MSCCTAWSLSNRESCSCWYTCCGEQVHGGMRIGTQMRHTDRQNTASVAATIIDMPVACLWLLRPLSPAQPALSATVWAAAQQIRCGGYCGVLRTQLSLWVAGTAESYHAFSSQLGLMLHAYYRTARHLKTSHCNPTNLSAQHSTTPTPHHYAPAEMSVLPSLLKAAARADPFILSAPTLLLLPRLTSPMWPLSPRKATRGWLRASGLTTKLSQLFMPALPLLPEPLEDFHLPPPRLLLLLLLLPLCCLLGLLLVLPPAAAAAEKAGLLLGAPEGARLMQGGVTTRSSWPVGCGTHEEGGVIGVMHSAE